MEFTVSRASCNRRGEDSVPPCDDAYEVEYIPNDVYEGSISEWRVLIDSLESLMAFTSKYGDIIINYNDDVYMYGKRGTYPPSIRIYDDYIE